MRLFPMLFLVASLFQFGCSEGSEAGTTGTDTSTGAGGELSGIWERQTADGSGDETDIAIGVIKGEPANRVWACEVRPNVPAIILQRGTITGNRIRWDEVHGGVPDYFVRRAGSGLGVRVDFPGASETNYSRGTWNRFCPELEDTRIFVLFTMTGGPGAVLTSASSSLPCARTPAIGQRYGGCPVGSFTYSVTSSNGLSSNNVPARLEKPVDGMKRLYRVGYHYNPILNRYLVGWPYEDISNVGGRIAIATGDAQVGERGATLPVPPTARILTPQGAPVVGATVHFRVVEGEGQISQLSVLTDSNGLASPGAWRLGTSPGPNRMTASALDMDGSPISFTATGTEDQLRVVSGAGSYTCALSEAARLLCWGYGIGAGAYHRPLTVFIYRPSEADNSIRLSSLDAGDQHACGLTAQGQALCWGADLSGNLGRGTSGGLGFPDTVLTATRFVSVSAGGYHSCALTSTGSAFCWGDNRNGQLGNGSTTNRSTPVAVAGGRSFVQITTGRFHSCGVTAAGQVYCWGLNAAGVFDVEYTNGGALGDGTLTNRLMPTLVSGGHDFTSVSAGDFATCGVQRDSKVRCWGDNALGWLATTSTAAAVLVPAPLNGSTNFAKVTLGRAHACGITAGGAVYCWGSNLEGAVGNDGPASTVSTPALIVGSYASVTAGKQHSCAVSLVGSQVYCWGRNTERQLGVDNAGPLRVPTPITPERETFVPLP